MIIDRHTNQVISPTIFPDHTSQVWHLDSLDIRDLWWYFESEAEIFSLLQLFNLVQDIPYIVIPYMPYGRQDKEISNDSTFAMKPFWELVELFFPPTIYTFDLHNPQAIGRSLTTHLVNVSPVPIIENMLHHGDHDDNPYDLVIYPDSGAETRLSHEVDFPFATLSKHREASSGRIDYMKCPVDLTEKRVIVVDDICDGGATFLRAASACYHAGAKSVGVYASHGIFSKGISEFVLHNICDIQTTNSYRGQFAGTQSWDIEPYIYDLIEQSKAWEGEVA